MDRKIFLYVREVRQLIRGVPVPPITCEIDPSNKCNLRCSFCMYQDFRAKSSCHLDIDIFEDLLPQLRGCGVKSITFTGGGEPLMHPNIVYMIESALERSFDIGLITNGHFIHRIPLALLSRMKFIRVSLDAATEGTYYELKGSKDFKRVLENVQLLVRNLAPTTTVGLSYVVSAVNAGEVEEAKQLSKSLGVKYIQFKPAWEKHGIFPNAVGSAAEDVFVAIRHKATDFLPCAIAGLVGIVAATGKVYYCCQHRGDPYYELGDLRKADFYSLWRKRPDVHPKIEQCPQCRYSGYASQYASIPPMLFEHENFL